MKGLLCIPGNKQLLSTYNKLQSDKTKISIKEITIWTQWVRFDPRLAEQLVSYLSRKWTNILPKDLNAEMIKQPWPAAIGLLIENIIIFKKHHDQESKQEISNFTFWASIVMSGIGPSNNEQFFIGLRPLASKLMKRDVLLSLDFYRRWGYFGFDVLINKFKYGKLTLISKEVRTRFLTDLRKRKKRLTVDDYRRELFYRVSVRQAERDLNECKRIKPVGNTRARYYRGRVA